MSYESAYHEAMMHLDALLHLLKREGYDPSIQAIADALAFVADEEAK